MLRFLADLSQGEVKMNVVKRLGTVAVAAGLAMALMAPSCAQARNGRTPGFAVDAVQWGPAPPFYPYYHFGYYGVPVWDVGPLWEPYDDGCYRQAAWTSRHRRHARVCD
jgi:hypothetical protein